MAWPGTRVPPVAGPAGPVDGRPVGETVLELRRDFLRGHGNPLGLVYAVYCDADTRVAPALARVQAG